jgi:hypothetical protein
MVGSEQWVDARQMIPVPHENGRLSKERSCARSISQVVEKKSGCATCFWAILAEKVRGAPLPPLFL